ncbi:alpha/beta fold hydrolase [Pseudomonas sp. S1_G07]
MNAPLLYVRTSMLDIAYETHGPAEGEPVILLHGFPYDPRSYDAIAPVLAERGYRVLVPYLRGYGPTRFINAQVMRSGQQAALAQDLLEFMDALRIPQATLAGYDWGGGPRVSLRRYGRNGCVAWSPQMATTSRTLPSRSSLWRQKRSTGCGTSFTFIPSAVWRA